MQTKLKKNFKHPNKPYIAINFINLNKEQKNKMLSIRNNKNISKWMQIESKITNKEHINFIDNLKKDYKKDYFAVLKDNKIIGMCGFSEIDFINKNAFINIYSKESKIGYGSEILDFIKYIAFIEFNLNVIHAKVLEDNIYAIEFYKKHNFKEYGRLINSKIRNNDKLIDILILSLKDDCVYSS